MNLKNKKKNNLGKFSLIILLAIFLVGFSYFSFLNGNSNIDEEVVASVNGQEITAEEVEAIQQSFSQQGQQISKEDAIEQVINQEVLFQKVKQEGISVTNEEAESAIKQQLAMQGATLDSFKQQLETQGVSYQDEIENIKDQLATQNYLESELENQEFEVTEEEAKEFYEMYKQQSPEELPSYEEIESQIIMTLEQQKQQEAMSSLIQEIRLNSDVEYY